MNIAWIFVTYHTPQSDIARLKKHLKQMGVPSGNAYFISNDEDNKGYAAALNEGIRRAMADGADLFVTANTDISLDDLSQEDIVNASRRFDVFGFSMRQQGTEYFGGELDRWRMSGALIPQRPDKRYVSRDFVSGSLMAIKKKVVDEIGYLDERYFMYYEDVDFCIRARKHEFRVGIDADRQYEHFESSGANPEKKYFLAKNRLKVLLAHGNPAQKMYEMARLPKTLYEEKRLMKRILLSDPFFLNFISLNISSLTNKLLNFILFIFLVKYLTPGDYGIYTLVWAHIGLLSPLMDLGTTSYGIIYGQRKDLRLLFPLFSLRTYVSIAVFILTVALAFIFGYDARTIGYVSLISFVILSNALSGSFLILTSIIERVFFSSLFSVVFNAAMIVFLVMLTYTTRDLNALFFTVFVFYCFYGLSNLIGIHRVLSARLSERAAERHFLHFLRASVRISWATWYEILRKSYVFILLSLFAGLYSRGDVFIIHHAKGADAVGIYSAGYKFFDALLFISASYNVSALPLFKRLKHEGAGVLWKRVRRDAVLLGALGAAAGILFMILAPLLLPLILKGTFSSSISVAQITMFALPFVLVNSIFLDVLYVYHKPYTVLWLFVLQMAINLGLNAWLVPHYSYIASAYLTVFSEMLNLCILLFVTIKVINSHRTHENLN